MGNIVAIACSTRPDGSSASLTDAFLDGAMGLSTNIVTLHRPAKFKSIQDCNYCLNCKATGKCILNDDVKEILDDVIKADCVVFSTPLFFGGPNALYKLIEDRMYAFLDSSGKSILKPGKKAVLIITCSEPDQEMDTLANLLSKNLETFGFEIMDVIKYCDNYGKNPASENSELVKRVKELGKTMRNTPTK